MLYFNTNMGATLGCDPVSDAQDAVLRARADDGPTTMPTKRAILGELTSHELRANVDFYELQIDDRRVKAQLVDALAGSRKARLDEVLPAQTAVAAVTLIFASARRDTTLSNAPGWSFPSIRKPVLRELSFQPAFLAAFRNAAASSGTKSI